MKPFIILKWQNKDLINVIKNSDLIFDVELLSCEKDELADMDMADLGEIAATGRLKLE